MSFIRSGLGGRARDLSDPVRGATLIELIVAFFLMSLLLLITYQLLTPGLRTWAASNLRSQVEQSALVAINRISRDLQSTCMDSIAVFPQQVDDADTHTREELDGFSCLSPYDISGAIQQQPDGPVIWQQHRVFYVSATTHELFTGTRPLTYDAGGALQYRLSAILAQTDDRILARYVRGLQLERAQDEGVGRPTTAASASPEWTNPITVKVHVWHNGQQYRLETGFSALMVIN